MLVIEKLTQPHDFFATSLCKIPLQIWLGTRLELTYASFSFTDNEIETKPQFKVDRKNWLYYCTLQRHANLLVDINYDRYKNIEEALEELKASVQQKYDNIDTNLTDYVDDDAYKRLTELGEGAIAHIMVEWKTSSNEQANRIWELLINDIIHGRRLGNLESRLGHWEDWSDWFENKDFDDAP